MLIVAYTGFFDWETISFKTSSIGRYDEASEWLTAIELMANVRNVESFIYRDLQGFPSCVLLILIIFWLCSYVPERFPFISTRCVNTNYLLNLNEPGLTIFHIVFRILFTHHTNSSAIFEPNWNPDYLANRLIALFGSSEHESEHEFMTFHVYISIIWQIIADLRFIPVKIL